MRTTVDLSDDFFKRLKIVAAQRGITLKELFHVALRHELSVHAKQSTARRVRFPLLPSKRPSSLRLTNHQIEEFLA